MDENKEITYAQAFSIVYILGFLGFIIYSMFVNSPIITTAALAVILVITTTIFIYRKSNKRTDVLERNICKRLDKQGYRHEKQEGTLYVTKNDHHFRIFLEDTYNQAIKHLYVFYEFGDDNFGKVSNEGWARATNSINVNNTRTTFVVLENHFCCCYQTSIGHAKDFQKEFECAYHLIGGALEDYKRLYPYLERDYPNTISENKNSIGFK